MIRSGLIRLSRLFYVFIAKPILFRFPPDDVHENMTRLSSLISRTTSLLSIMKRIFGSRDAKIRQDLHCLSFKSPVGLAAGFDKNGEIIPVIASLGFGFGEVGSVSYKKCKGNPKPWFYRLPKTKSAVINAGLCNDGSEKILARLRKYNPKSLSGFPVVLSVVKANDPCVVSEKQGIDDYISTLKLAKNEKTVQILEINISCPNAYGGEPFTTPAKLERLLNAVDKLDIKQPVFIKMPIDLEWRKFKELLDVIIKHNVAGVTVANLSKDRTRIDFLDELPDGIKGSFSGKPTWQDSNELIKKTYQQYGKKLTVIGVGGIFDAEDAYTKIRLGASLVQLVTGMLFNGPQIAAEINEGLVKLLERDGFNNIQDAVGVDAR